MGSRLSAPGGTSSLTAPVRRKQCVKHIVAPGVPHAQVVTQQALALEPEFLDQRDRRSIIGLDVGLNAVQAEFAEAEVEHRRDRLGREALPLAARLYDIADAHALTADMAVVVVDEAKAAVRNRVGCRPKPIIGRRTVDEVAYGALGFDTLREDRLIPVAHRLGVSETFVHRIRILGAELAQPQTGG
jgi:hypothetical protein